MKKFICLFLGIVMVGCILTACGSSEEKEEEKEETSVSEEVEEIEEGYVAPVTTEEINVSYNDIRDLFETETIELPVGSTSVEFLQAINSTNEKVNYTSYDLNSVDFDTPGTYSFSASLNVSPEVAKEYVPDLELNDDTESVNLKFYYDVTITDTPSENAEEVAEENVETAEEPEIVEAEVVEEQPETPEASETYVLSEED